MDKRIKSLKKLLSIFMVVVIVSVSVNIINSIIIDNKIKSFDKNDDKSLFELCEYLYDTKEYAQIYKYFSKIFYRPDAIQFFSDQELESEEAKRYLSFWGAKFLISSTAIDNSTKIDDFMLIFEIVENIGIEKYFIATLTEQIYIEYGSYISFFESYHLKKFLTNMSFSLENDLKQEFKIEAYSFLVGAFSSMGDFASSHDYSWKRDSEIYKNSSLNKTEVQ